MGAEDDEIEKEEEDVFRRRGGAMDVWEVWGGEFASGELDRERDARALSSSLAEKGDFFLARSLMHRLILLFLVFF